MLRLRFCINDNRSYSAIDDPKPPVGSYNQEDVRRLSAHVVKLQDMPEGMLVLPSLSRVWKSRTRDLVIKGSNRNVMGIHDFLCLPKWIGVVFRRRCIFLFDLAACHLVEVLRMISEVVLQVLADHKSILYGLRSERFGVEFYVELKPALQRLLFYCTPPATVDVAIPDPTPKDLAAGMSSAKVMAKAKSSKKRKTLLSRAAPSHVAKFTRSTVAQSSRSTTRPKLFAADSDEERNQSRGSATPVAEDSHGKGIMTDVTKASFRVVGRPRPSFGSDPSLCDLREEWDAPHQSTLMILTKEVFKDPVVCKTVVDHFPTLREMVRIEALSTDQLTAKMSAEKSLRQANAKGKGRKNKIKSLTKNLDQLNVEVARLSAALNQASILEAEKDDAILRLKASPRSLFPSFEVGELLSLVSSAGFEHGLSIHRTHEEFAAVLKKISHFAPGAQDRLTEASSLIAQTEYSFLNKISDHAANPLSFILHLDPEKLARPANVPAPKDTRVSPPVAKESTVTPVTSSLELLSKIDGYDGSALDGSERVSSGPNEVVVALSVGGRDDGTLPSSSVGEEAVAAPYGV
ncbi:hypothetical protein Tco_0454762 [Tanacetum coccineum]